MSKQRILWGAMIAAVLGGTMAAAENPMLDKTDLFTAGQAGYETFRIPGVVVLNSEPGGADPGVILAYCEARRGSRSDWADIEVLLTRSVNGGRTWSPPVRIADSGKDTVNNPVAIVDRETGRVHFLYCINYHQVFYMYSDESDDPAKRRRLRNVAQVAHAAAGR